MPVMDENLLNDVVAAALRSGAAFFTEERRAWSRARQRVIDANPGLQERERHKMAALAGLVHDALLGRGVADPVARLAAEATPPDLRPQPSAP